MKRVAGLPEPPANDLLSERTASGRPRRLALFVFGVVPSDPWRMPSVAWGLLGLSSVLLSVSFILRHWSGRPMGLDATTVATVATVAHTGGSVVLFLTIVGVALARARRLMAPSNGQDRSA